MGPSDMKNAIVLQLLNLCVSRGMTTYELAQKARLSPGSLYGILSKTSKDPGVRSMRKLCAGLEVSMKEFFNGDIFQEQESR